MLISKYPLDLNIFANANIVHPVIKRNLTLNGIFNFSCQMRQQNLQNFKPNIFGFAKNWEIICTKTSSNHKRNFFLINFTRSEVSNYARQVLCLQLRSVNRHADYLKIFLIAIEDEKMLLFFLLTANTTKERRAFPEICEAPTRDFNASRANDFLPFANGLAERGEKTVTTTKISAATDRVEQ